MRWTDQGIVLHARPFGEAGVVLSALTPQRGRHDGLLRGGAGRRLAAAAQPGSLLELTWRARLADQLGAFTVELRRPPDPRILGRRGPLAAMLAACALVHAAAAERDPHGASFQDLAALLGALALEDGWPEAYLAWERRLIADLGCAPPDGDAGEVAARLMRQRRILQADVFAAHGRAVPPARLRLEAALPRGC